MPSAKRFGPSYSDSNRPMASAIKASYWARIFGTASGAGAVLGIAGVGLRRSQRVKVLIQAEILPSLL